MNLSLRFKRTVFALWLALVPLSLYLVYHYFPPPAYIEWPNFIGFVTLAIITAIFPFVINGVPLFLIQWVHLAIFLKYGLFVELIVFQIVLIPFSYRAKLPRSEFYRIPWNSIMFFIVSFISGVFFILIGGKFGSLSIWHIVIFGILYLIINTLVNHVLLKFSLIVMKKRTPFLTKDDYWDYLSMLFTFPMGLSLYLLLEYVGSVSFILLGAPFLVVAQILRMYSTSETANHYLSMTAHFGHQLADHLTSDEVVDLFMKKTIEIMPVDHAYIINICEDNLQFHRAHTNGTDTTLELSHGNILKSPIQKIVDTEQTIVYSQQTEWISMGLGFLPVATQSIVMMPISRNQKMVAILLLASNKKKFFEEYQIQILDLLCSYFAVSVERSRYMEATLNKSERCGLTGLYNYRYFEEQLTKKMQSLLDGEIRQLSLIMLDIDHFKGINDTYGHQSGNIILCDFARLLEDAVGDHGVLARYGGEEFVILLPNMSKGEAFNLAEEIRMEVQQSSFGIESDLGVERKKEFVSITTSVGVSTAPEDCDKPISLLRNADRALYVGAKQKGRNRVAEYVK
ncbi:GGDEF domain-containing protein [Viridibacillus sp. YIM B01967]|uniref:GGDEF domain-containing protein n=1 Tax=Viridibacillus soli TaxID=2798301 RepID=A0ABS1H238_9BACL|nr:sensor domain-containing diguanylate cyclase [Viridibacillus soli]MBK3493451.1 GGDEF domain-containing protein [Viridibacillus soli]